jgi:hypothetical protein
MSGEGFGAFVLPQLFLCRSILAALRQKFHLSTCPNLADHLFDRLAALKCDPIAGMARIAMDKKAPRHPRPHVFRNSRNTSRRSARRSNTPLSLVLRRCRRVSRAEV